MNDAEVTVEPQRIGVDSKGRFVKGFSGNPGGKPKGLGEMQQMARAETERNIDAMIYLRDNANAETVRLAAAKILHEIGWGKPKESVDVTTNERVIDALRLGNGTTQGTS